MSHKVLLVGSFGVGKTSLLRAFLGKSFEEKYQTTVGVSVQKTTLTHSSLPLEIHFWDCAGEVRQDKIPASYFYQAKTILYVLDLSRPSTHQRLEADLAHLKQQAPFARILVIGNKRDLVSTPPSLPLHYLTSAQTGEQVQDVLHDLLQGLLVTTPI